MSDRSKFTAPPLQEIRKRRERYLSTEEIARLGLVLTEAEEKGEESPVAILAVRLLLLTGTRKSETLKLKWSEVDFERSRLRLTNSPVGEREIPLSAPVLELLKKAPRIEGNPYVCAGRRTGTHFVGLKPVWDRLRDRAGLEDAKLYSLRHTFAAIGPEGIAACLGLNGQAGKGVADQES